MNRTTWFLLSLVSAGCLLRAEDFDQDGWSQEQGDCADLDPLVHPQAADEIGDGIDQNCDGVEPLMEVSGEDHFCQLAEGDVSCTGDNRYGQLDVPDVDFAFIQIAAGDFHTCGLESTGTVVCWGRNEEDQCSPPVDGPFVSIEADANWSLGILEVGGPLCWGTPCLTPNDPP